MTLGILRPQPDDDAEHYVVEIQSPNNNWIRYASINDIDAASEVVNRLATILGTARVVDVMNDRMVVFEKFYTPPPRDDRWDDDDDDALPPHDWKEEGF